MKKKHEKKILAAVAIAAAVAAYFVANGELDLATVLAWFGQEASNGAP